MSAAAVNPGELDNKESGLPKLKLALALLVLGFGVLSYTAVRLALDPARFPVSEVRVVGDLRYADRETLQAIVDSHAESGFYGLDLQQLRESVEAVPWVRSASVRRLWPSALMVKVEEHEARARWNESELISSDFSVFMPPQYRLEGQAGTEWQKYFAQLPQISGVDGRHAALYELYRVVSRQLATLGDPIVEIHEDERRSVRIVLSSGVWINLGRERGQGRLELFSQIYKRVIEPDITGIVGVDMRYPNGFSVKYGE
ncbi:MAG: cell division protein FtsQ/DivIB, partial [Granulosicoccaceae bacterium]